jgi:hypothetical protein
MSRAFCIGAYDMDNHKNIRLLTSEGNNQPLDTHFEIGQIWNIDYVQRDNIVRPHTEDILIEKIEFIENINNITDYLTKHVPIWRDEPSNIFNGKVNFPIGKAGFIEQRNASLDQSVGFWIPDKSLELTILEDKKHYLYFGEQVYSFPFVGAMGKVETIPRGTLLRVSLTRWWSPNPNQFQKRCYCQLSGWFDLSVQYDNNKAEITNEVDYDFSF